MIAKRLVILIILVLILTLGVGLFACSKAPDKQSTVIISFNTDGGEPNFPNLTLKVGDGIILPEEEPKKDGFVFTGWYLDNECTTKLNPNVYRAVSSKTIFAGWESVETYPHAIKVSSKIEDGTVIVSHETASMGTTVTVTVKPNGGYKLTSGSLKFNNTEIDLSTETPSSSMVAARDYTFTMPAEPVTIYAEFESVPYDVTINNKITNGSVYLSTTSAKPGEIVAVNAVPDVGYKLDKITVNNTTLVVNGLFVMPSTTAIINAEFSPINHNEKYNISISENSNVDVYTDLTSASHGEYVIVSAIPKEGYRLLNVKYNNTIIEGEGFIMPDFDVVITATVTPISKNNLYTLSIATPANGVAQIINPKTSYGAGERVEINVIPNEGYTLESISVNGIYFTDNVIVMPEENAVVTVKFIDKGHSITTRDLSGYGGKITTSTDYAYAGEVISITVKLGEGYIENNTLRYNKAGTSGKEYVLITSNTFIMPDYDIYITVEPVRVQGEPHAVNIDSNLSNGVILANTNSASIYQTVNLEIAPNDGYRLKEGSLKILYNNEDRVISEDFLMPNNDVTVTAIFEKVYKITAFETENVSLYPDKIVAAPGEWIYVDIDARGNTDANNIICYKNGTKIDISQRFLMPEEDVTLTATSNETKYGYNITIEKVNGGKITCQQAAQSGSVVHINVVPEDGYLLKSITLKETHENSYIIPDNFIMPQSAITLIPEFVEDTTPSFNLDKAYENNVNTFNTYGFVMSYARTKHQLKKIFVNSPELRLTNYIEGILSVTSDVTHNFYAIEVNDVSMANAIAQKACKNIEELNNGKEINAHIISNYIIISAGGNAYEDFSLLKNGLTPYQKFIMYKRDNGTYGVYTYFGNDSYICIPDKINNRIVGYVAPYAFKNAKNVLGINLTNVRELADNALVGLSQIKSIDLTDVEKIGKGVFRDCFSLEKFVIGKSNSNYVSKNGVLYTYDTSVLVAYPANAPAIGYKILASTKKIADYAFYGAKNLSAITYPTHLQYVGDYAFANVVNLEQVYRNDYPNPEPTSVDLTASSLTYLGNGAFSGNKLIKTYRFNNGLTFIGSNAIDANWDNNVNISIIFNGKTSIYDNPFTCATIPNKDKLTIYVLSANANFYNANNWQAFNSNIIVE